MNYLSTSSLLESIPEEDDNPLETLKRFQSFKDMKKNKIHQKSLFGGKRISNPSHSSLGKFRSTSSKSRSKFGSSFMKFKRKKKKTHKKIYGITDQRRRILDEDLFAFRVHTCELALSGIRKKEKSSLKINQGLKAGKYLVEVENDGDENVKIHCKVGNEEVTHTMKEYSAVHKSFFLQKDNEKIELSLELPIITNLFVDKDPTVCIVYIYKYLEEGDEIFLQNAKIEEKLRKMESKKTKAVIFENPTVEIEDNSETLTDLFEVGKNKSPVKGMEKGRRLNNRYRRIELIGLNKKKGESDSEDSDEEFDYFETDEREDEKTEGEIELEKIKKEIEENDKKVFLRNLKRREDESISENKKETCENEEIVFGENFPLKKKESIENENEKMIPDLEIDEKGVVDYKNKYEEMIEKYEKLLELNKKTDKENKRLKTLLDLKNKEMANLHYDIKQMRRDNILKEEKMQSGKQIKKQIQELEKENLENEMKDPSQKEKKNFIVIYKEEQYSLQMDENKMVLTQNGESFLIIEYITVDNLKKKVIENGKMVQFNFELNLNNKEEKISLIFEKDNGKAFLEEVQIIINKYYESRKNL